MRVKTTFTGCVYSFTVVIALLKFHTMQQNKDQWCPFAYPLIPEWMSDILDMLFFFAAPSLLQFIMYSYIFHKAKLVHLIHTAIPNLQYLHGRSNTLFREVLILIFACNSSVSARFPFSGKVLRGFPFSCNILPRSLEDIHFGSTRVVMLVYNYCANYSQKLKNFLIRKLQNLKNKNVFIENGQKVFRKAKQFHMTSSREMNKRWLLGAHDVDREFVQVLESLHRAPSQSQDQAASGATNQGAPTQGGTAAMMQQQRATRARQQPQLKVAKTCLVATFVRFILWLPYVLHLMRLAVKQALGYIKHSQVSLLLANASCNTLSFAKFVNFDLLEKQVSI